MSDQLEVKRIIKQIKLMDKTSDEFCELHQAINEMYFSFDNPDDYQISAKVLNLVLNKGDEWMVQVLAKFANSLFEVVDKDMKAAHASFEISDKKMFFYDVYQNKDAIEQVHKIFRNTVSMRSKLETQ